MNFCQPRAASAQKVGHMEAYLTVACIKTLAVSLKLLAFSSFASSGIAQLVSVTSQLISARFAILPVIGVA